MKFDKKYISGRFTAIVIVTFLICGWITWRMVDTMIIHREKWKEVGRVSVSDTLTMKANRGNILSSDGKQIMASSLPNYRLYVDFMSGGADKDEKVMEKKDSMWRADMDSICSGLYDICPYLTKDEFKKHLTEGLEKRKRYWEVCPRHVLNYIQYHEIIKLPIFNEKNKNKSGLVVVEYNNRNKPFGTLAKRTLGELYGAKDSARSGIELAYDSILRGKPGKVHHKKVFNKYLNIIDLPPVDGSDVVSTLDISMQDICESALREKVTELEASMGVVILMEVKTGDVKAIVNLVRYDDGNYYESRNFALASLMEPGSTFKTASIMVALDDGVIKMTDQVDTGCGVYNMHGALMKDHNWTRGGYHVIDVPHTLMYSSNIGVSRLIDEHYHNQPEKFVEGLRRIGIGASLDLPFAGSADPQIRMPIRDSKGGFKNSPNWSATALPWMSIGYETQIPPISTCAFYNAIANNGKMVQPRFVKGISQNGEMVEEFPTKVIRENICKNPQTLKYIQETLYRVVNEEGGVGRKAGNKYFHVSGKTGTAQVSNGAGYHGGKREHLVSFCGYFPSEEPRYTCIVAIRHAYYVASGGSQAGVVFSKISQRVYSKNLTTDISRAADSTSVFVPDVKTGDAVKAKYVLKELDISVDGNVSKEWATASIDGKKVKFTPLFISDNSVPDVIGMGARDAVFALENKGIKTRVKGRGKVKNQSIPAGSKVEKGSVITLEMTNEARSE